MRLLSLILVLLYAKLALTHQRANAGWWRDWCERHLIADDPYQYKSLTTDQLVTAWLKYPNHALRREIESRIALAHDHETIEILTKLIK